MKICRKTFQLFALVLFAAALHSCETEIPPEDLTPPKFSFRIQGAGIDHTFTQDSNYLELRLRRNTVYNYTFSSSDVGGVAHTQWFADSRLSFNEPIQSPWIFNYATSSTPQSIEWFGDPYHPLTGNIIAGSFTTQENYGGFNFRFKVSDFGGELDNPNEIEKTLYFYNGDHVGVIEY